MGVWEIRIYCHTKSKDGVSHETLPIVRKIEEKTSYNIDGITEFAKKECEKQGKNFDFIVQIIIKQPMEESEKTLDAFFPDSNKGKSDVESSPIGKIKKP